MINKLLIIIIFFVFSIPTIIFAENISTKKLYKIETVLWQKTVLLEQGANNSKVYNGEPLLFGYFEDQEWIVRNEQKELFRAVNNKIKVYDTNPRYISFWTKNDAFNELTLKTLQGDKVELPPKVKTIELIQKTKADEVYVQYWLESTNPIEIRNLGTVIKSTGEAIFPLDYYFYFLKEGIHGNDWYSIIKKGSKNALFYNNNELLLSERIKTTESIEETSDYIIVKNQNQEYLHNIKTGWESEKFKSIPFFKNNLIVANYSGDDFSNNGNFKFLKLEKDSLSDITPTLKELDLFIPVRIHDNHKLTAFFIREKNSSKIKYYKLLNNHTWATPEETFLNFDNMTITLLNAWWHEDKKMYHFFGHINSKNITMFYDNKSKILLQNLFGGNKDGSLFYVFHTNFDEEKNYNRLLYFTIVNRQGKILFEKKQFDDGFINEDTTKFFYKENGSWEVFDIENNTTFSFFDIVELKTNKMSDVAFYKTITGEQGLLLLNNDTIIPLSKEIKIEEFLYGSSKDKLTILKVNNNKQIQLLKLTWQNN